MHLDESQYFTEGQNVHFDAVFSCSVVGSESCIWEVVQFMFEMSISSTI